jgi:hypothetical protein
MALQRAETAQRSLKLVLLERIRIVARFRSGKLERYQGAANLCAMQLS